MNRYLLLTFCALLLSGCGYHNPAVASREAGAVSIYAGTWENRTDEVALEGLLLQKTADWLQQSPLLRLESDPDDADFRLSGTIQSVSLPATAYNSNDLATTLKAWVKVTYRLTARDGKTIWEINDTVRERNYAAGNDALHNRTNKEDALAVIADEVAEQIYLKVLITVTTGPLKGE